MKLKIFTHEQDRHDSDSILDQFNAWVLADNPTILTLAGSTASPYPGDCIEYLYVLYETET